MYLYSFAFQRKIRKNATISCLAIFVVDYLGSVCSIFSIFFITRPAPVFHGSGMAYVEIGRAEYISKLVYNS